MSAGKKLPADDEKAIKAAQSIIEKEFAFVLDIHESEVDSYIRSRLDL